jgi:hypothetical protein
VRALEIAIRSLPTRAPWPEVDEEGWWREVLVDRRLRRPAAKSLSTSRLRGPRGSEVATKTPLLIVLTTVVVVAGGALAIMNKACKTGEHRWCAPISDIRQHVRTGHS